MRHTILLSIALLLTGTAHAHPVGETHRTIPLPSAVARHVDHRATMDVTIWYPAAAGAVERPETIGPPAAPYFRVAMVARDAQPARGKRPVVLLSHGFGGSARMMGWLGAALAREGFITIGVDHPGNSDGDMSDVGSIAWWERPRDMIAALRAAALDERFAPLIDRNRVGAAGFSMGGMTALALAGARIDPNNFDRFCSDEPNDGVCQKPAERKDQPDISRAEGVRLLGLEDAQAHAAIGTALPGLKAALAIAPPSQELSQDSLRRIRIPVVIVAGDADTVVPPRNHAIPAARHIAGAKLVLIKGAAHYSFLAMCTAAARGNGGACDHAPAQDVAHTAAIAAALTLFCATLSSSRPIK